MKSFKMAACALASFRSCPIMLGRHPTNLEQTNYLAKAMINCLLFANHYLKASWRNSLEISAYLSSAMRLPHYEIVTELSLDRA